MVHGDPVHRAPFPAGRKSKTDREHIHLDVPHLWLRKFSGAHLPAVKRKKPVIARRRIHLLHFLRRICDWLFPEEIRRMPLGLQRSPLEHQRLDPPWLCAPLVRCRIIIWKNLDKTLKIFRICYIIIWKIFNGRSGHEYSGIQQQIKEHLYRPSILYRSSGFCHSYIIWMAGYIFNKVIQHSSFPDIFVHTFIYHYFHWYIFKIILSPIFVMADAILTWHHIGHALGLLAVDDIHIFLLFTS